jgi:polysaccharide export outer membrane protein
MMEPFPRFAAICSLTVVLSAGTALAQQPDGTLGPATTDAVGTTGTASAGTAGSPDAGNVGMTASIRESRTAEYYIGPEDILDILVWKNPELSRTVPVRPDGKVSLPLVNDIQAAGLTPTELREQLAKRLGEYVPAAEVAVIVREVHSVKVAVVGSVRVPGRYEVNSPATVLELIAQAQGLTEFASKDRIVVIRQTATGSQRIPFNYRRVADGSEKDNFFVQAGDIIVVP